MSDAVLKYRCVLTYSRGVLKLVAVSLKEVPLDL